MTDFEERVYEQLREHSSDKFVSTYEGLMAIQEKFESLKREVYEKQSDEKIFHELISVAAMCHKFHEDLFLGINHG